MNKALLEYLCDNFDGEIHLSFGMTSKKEEEQIVSFFEEKRRNKDLVIYCCTSGYPVPFENDLPDNTSIEVELYSRQVLAGKYAELLAKVLV